MFDIDDMRERLKSLSKNILSFGVGFLDDSCGGILKNDLIVLAAKTGLGKSALSASIGLNNALAGKNVYLFALEAFKYEVESRNVFNMAMNCYYKHNRERIDFVYQDYLMDRTPENVLPYIADAEEQVRVLADNLHVIYRTKDYTMEDFEKDLMSIDMDADLVIIDHLHFLSYDETKEYSEISKIMKRLHDITQLSNIPIVLVSHLSKSKHFGTKKLIPSIEDLHGSSNIGKMATKVIILAPDFQAEQKTSCEFPTIMRVAKNRYNGGVIKYVGLMNYDIRINQYSDTYYLAKLDYAESEYTILNDNFPSWRKDRRYGKPAPTDKQVVF